MNSRNAPEERGPKPLRYSFLAELLETTHRNEAKLERVLEKQEDTTAMILALKEHKTIEKTDEVYTTMTNVLFAGRVATKVFAWSVGIGAALAGIAWSTHQLFGWF